MVSLAMKSVGKKHCHPVAQTWGFLHRFLKQEDYSPLFSKPSLTDNDKDYLNLTQIPSATLAQKAIGPVFFPFFFFPPTPLADAPFTLSPQTHRLFYSSPFFCTDHLVLTTKSPVLQGEMQEFHPPLLCLPSFLYNKSKARTEHDGFQASQ